MRICTHIYIYLGSHAILFHSLRLRYLLGTCELFEPSSFFLSLSLSLSLSDKPKLLLVFSGSGSDRLNQRITTRLVELLNAVDQVQGGQVAVVAEMELGTLSAIICHTRAISELDRRVVRQRLVVERPRPLPVPRVRMCAHSRALETQVDVDEVMDQEVPMSPLVLPEERVFARIRVMRLDRNMIWPAEVLSCVDVVLLDR